MPISRDMTTGMYILQTKILGVLDTNPGKDKPYHNNQHMQGVWDIVQKLWVFERDTNDPVENERSLTILMIASLLHDYDHSGGETSDHYNVLRTREFVEELLKNGGLGVSDDIRFAVDSAIACTEYPFIIEPSCHLEKVLRDADILYAALSLNPHIILEDLRAEITVAAKRPISYQEMLNGQLKFMDSVVLYTTTGKGIWERNSQQYLKLLTNYVNEKEAPE